MATAEGTLGVKDAASATKTLHVWLDSEGYLHGTPQLFQGDDVVSGTNQLPVRTQGGITVLEASFTRPSDTTPYTANDLVGPTTSSADPSLAIAISSAVFANGDGFRIERARLKKSDISRTNAQFRLHFWRDLPTFTGIGDNGAQGAVTALVCASMDYYVDYIDVTMDRASSTASGYAQGVGVPSVGNGIVIRPRTGTSFYVSVQAIAAYTPVSGETFVIALEGLRA